MNESSQCSQNFSTQKETFLVGQVRDVKSRYQSVLLFLIAAAVVIATVIVVAIQKGYRQVLQTKSNQFFYLVRQDTLTDDAIDNLVSWCRLLFAPSAHQQVTRHGQMESLVCRCAKLWAKCGMFHGQIGNNFQSSVAPSIAGFWLGTMLFIWPLCCTAVGHHI